jgi:hypothetical protein
MLAVEIRPYCGDFEDVADLMSRVWIPEYRGRLWVPIPDVEYLGWRFGPASNAVCLAAYEGTKLVGTIFSAPSPLRTSGSGLCERSGDNATSSLCNLCCLCGYYALEINYQRDTEATEVAQRRPDFSAIALIRFNLCNWFYCFRGN